MLLLLTTSLIINLFSFENDDVGYTQASIVNVEVLVKSNILELVDKNCDGLSNNKLLLLSSVHSVNAKQVVNLLLILH